MADFLPDVDTVWELTTLLDALAPDYFDDVAWPDQDAHSAWQEFVRSHRRRVDRYFEGLLGVESFGDPPPNGATVDVYSTGLFGEHRIYAMDAERPIGVPVNPGSVTHGGAFRGVVADGGILKIAT